MRAVAVTLKIPDNTGYTALVTLRRLGVDVHRVERSDIWFYRDKCTAADLEARVKADETVYNPSKHRVTVLDKAVPRAGEVWIEPKVAEGSTILSGVEGQKAAVGWRLFDANNDPVNRAVLDAAIERLLCNPAIDRAVTDGNVADGDNPGMAE